MAFEERVQILSEAEQDELYGPPAFTSADQRFFFSLNDKELAIAKSLRHRGQRYMLVVLLGYFKAKPVVLNPGFHQIKQDLKYVYQTVLPGPGCRPFNLTPKENERIYQRVFQLCNYQRWNVKDHGAALRDYLSQQARAWTAPRHLFDAAIEYCSGQKIAIPAYSTLQKIISQVVGDEQEHMAAHLEPRIGVEADLGALADAHVGKVGFLEIGLDDFEGVFLVGRVVAFDGSQPIECVFIFEEHGGGDAFECRAGHERFLTKGLIGWM